MEIQNIFQMLTKMLLNNSGFDTLAHYVITINTIIMLVSVAFFIFVIFYVYENAPKYNMNKFLWIAIVIVVPKYMGFMTYLIVKAIKEGLSNNHSNEEVVFNNRVNHEENTNKKSIYKIVSVSVIIVILITAIYVVDREKLKPGEVVGSNVIRTKTLFRDEYRDFTGKEVKEIWFKEDGVLNLHYDSKVKKGDLTIGLYEYNGEPIDIFEADEKGQISISLKKNTIYKLIAEGIHTKGYYDFSWEFNENE
ncbi:MAG: hypothetical protein N4A62_14775 [Marinisporobacter sp.]|nr:hypothetical protein [Marinisporobacter sp.]